MRSFIKLNNKMSETNNYIAIILARGGSKGIKFKNLFKINNKPLIYWSIRDCLRSKKISSVWVSSDNLRILKYVKKFGARPILRPKKYAGDNSSSESAWLHAVNFLEAKNIAISNIVGIQPTSPLRNKKDLDNACKIFSKNKFDSLFSALSITDHFIWSKKKGKLFSNYNFRNRPRRQKIKEKYLENGSFYIFNKKKFLIHKNRLFEKIGVYSMSKINSFQIDDMDDVKIVNSLKKYF